MPPTIIYVIMGCNCARQHCRAHQVLNTSTKKDRGFTHPTFNRCWSTNSSHRLTAGSHQSPPPVNVGGQHTCTRPDVTPEKRNVIEKSTLFTFGTSNINSLSQCQSLHRIYHVHDKTPSSDTLQGIVSSFLPVHRHQRHRACDGLGPTLWWPHGAHTTAGTRAAYPSLEWPILFQIIKIRSKKKSRRSSRRCCNDACQWC